jgi:hypothetical protein
MSQQLLMWSVSPFLIQQLETEGVNAFEVFWNTDEDFEDEDIDLSDTAVAISKEAIAANMREGIEIQGGYAAIIHSLLANDVRDYGCGNPPLDFIIRKKEIDEKEWLLVNAFVGTKIVMGAEDYVASYFNPEEAQNIHLALVTIADEDFEMRCKTLFSLGNQSQIAITGSEIRKQGFRAEIADIAEAEEFIKSELIPIYSYASQQGYGVLIAWSI